MEKAWDKFKDYNVRGGRGGGNFKVIFDELKKN